MNGGATVERASDRDLVVRRTFDGPARLVFEAWTQPQLIMRWWAPTSFGLSFVSCETDVRTGGAYRFVFRHPAFEQTDGRTLVVVHDLYPSKAALDEAIANESTGGWPEQFEQLDGVLGVLGAGG
jgi:uncharacterized protein YndB with AHSA1/START domain